MTTPWVIGLIIAVLLLPLSWPLIRGIVRLRSEDKIEDAEIEYDASFDPNYHQGRTQRQVANQSMTVVVLVLATLGVVVLVIGSAILRGR